MSVHLRVARPVTDLNGSVAQYKAGLGLQVVGTFANHEGFDGVMLGTPGADHHLEFTFCRTHAVVPAPTPEDLLVFYVPEQKAWEGRCRAMFDAGFKEVEPYNPYWKRLGRTYEDWDGYRVVIQRAEWRNDPVELKRYLAVFTGSPSAMARWEVLPEAERQRKQAKGVAAWKKWATDNAASIVEMGGPLSRTKLVSTDGVSDIRNNLGAFTVVQAESQDAAARLFLNHPHFTIFPGEGVEVMEVLSIPAG
jgi:catechol 2,3-dioxygenase-like lactoylglutathione lyase family enzyme